MRPMNFLLFVFAMVGGVAVAVTSSIAAVEWLPEVVWPFVAAADAVLLFVYWRRLWELCSSLPMKDAPND